MKRLVVLALTLPVFLVGCGGENPNPNYDGSSINSDEGPRDDKVDADSAFTVIRDGDTDIHYWTFTTPDGMKCLTNYDGALSCDWEGAP